MGIEQASILNILQCVLVAKMPFTLLDHIKDKYCLLYTYYERTYHHISVQICFGILVNSSEDLAIFIHIYFLFYTMILIRPKV